MPEIKYQAAKYIRLSYTDDKDNESDSVANQRKFLDSFIENHPDIMAVSEKVDDGVSGVIFDRKAFKEMMAEIKDGKINCVIVKDLSRLGREYIETGRYLRSIFPAYGVRFIAVNDNIDTLYDDGDFLTVSVKNVVNDAYSRDISIKTRSALNAKRKRGDYVGACPVYGYKKDIENHNLLVIDEYPASVVRDIFHMKIEGMSAKQIAQTLNDLGVLSPMAYKRDRGLPHPKKGFADKPDSKWSATAIIRILKDETYTGTLIQGKQGTLNHKLKNLIDKPPAEWKRVESTHEAIIHRQDFDLAHRVMRLDTRTSPNGNTVYCFSGILICGCCGNRMTRKTVVYKDRKYFYYYCPTGKKNGCADSIMLKEDALCGCVLESVKSHIANIVSLESILAGSDGQKAALELARRYEAQIVENERQLAHVRTLKATLYENMVVGKLDTNEYKEYKAAYIADDARLNAAIEKLRQQQDDALVGKSERLRWMAHFKRFEGLTAIDRRMTASLIQSICVIGKSELQITFNYQDEYAKVLALIQRVCHFSEANTAQPPATKGVA